MDEVNWCNGLKLLLNEHSDLLFSLHNSGVISYSLENKKIEKMIIIGRKKDLSKNGSEVHSLRIEIMTLKAILRRTFRVYVVQLKLGDFSQG